MAQQLSTNAMPPETREASARVRAASAAQGINEIKLRRKYTSGGKAKKTRDKGGGNSGKTGARFRSTQRFHGGGRETLEQKAFSEQQSRAFSEWRSRWMTNDPGPQPG